MASSVASGDTGASNSNAPRGYAIQPIEEKPVEERRGKPDLSSAYRVNDDEETKISFSCQNATLFLKISSALLSVSFVLQTIAIGAPYWAAGWRRDKMSWHEGVWMTCYREELDNKWICGSYDYSNPKPGVPGWYTATQAMGLVSIVIFLPALMLNLFYTMHPKGKMFRGLLAFNFVLTFCTGLLPLIMIITFAAGHPRRDRFPISYLDEDYDDSPFQFHFSFVFEIFAVLVSFAAFALEIVDWHREDYSQI